MIFLNDDYFYTNDVDVLIISDRFSLAEVELSSAPVNVTTPHIKLGGFDSIDIPPTDFVCEFIENMTEQKKRSLLCCARDGMLTDESFLNVSNYLGPDRVQVSGLQLHTVTVTKYYIVSKILMIIRFL